MEKNAIRALIILLIIVMMPFPAFAVNEDDIPIHIDGYYDDWEDKPFTEVYPGHNPPESKINYVSLFRDEDNVYVHVLFAYKNNQDITNMIIDLYTNMGDESYFLVPDVFWYTDTQSEPDLTVDQSTDLSPLEQTPVTEDASGESLDESAPEDQNAPEDQGGATESTRQDTTTESPETTDTSNTTDTIEPADTTSLTTDEKTNNGQGNGSETNNDQGNDSDTSVPGTSKESGIGTNPTEGTDRGDFLNILNPDNLVDLDNVLDQFSTDEAADTSVPDDSADLNSNLNIKKPGWYGTWGFTVWNGLSPVGNGYYTRSEGEPDELELYIPLSSVAHHYDGITEISMRIKKLGPQHIMCTGVSTGAYIGIAAGAGIALMSVGAYTYKRRRPSLLGKGK